MSPKKHLSVWLLFALGLQLNVSAAPPFPIREKSNQASDSHDPANATAALDLAEGLSATLFASEPMLCSPSNIDVDHLGRVWVCEVKNYRGRNGTRPEGDRILILEDTDGDGVADKSTVFYQGRDIDSALGICVLGNKVIVSCSPNIFVFTDENGDGVADKKEVLFTKAGIPQHDHNAHTFTFGPDGKLYWNVGNENQGVCDKEGQRVVDLEGHEVNNRGPHYRSGMIFRCNLDGGEFEVLGHNFRNNYETAVDSFGTLWQSDNDDDGYRATRINYVMQHGNYGFLNEITGASWNTPYRNQPEDIPSRHWHLSDPGVVPNLLMTGSGAPSGIMVYEGELLPKAFCNQMIHCDPGPNLVRSYPVRPSGAGYAATIENIAVGARDNWFRPVDVCAAPDGSLIVADWYDPGVGGHGMADMDRGRIFRIAPSGTLYKFDKPDVSTIDGAIKALQSPNLSTRYLAWTKLHEAGDAAAPALWKLWETSENPRYRARAIWLLAKREGHESEAIDRAIVDPDPDLRITGLRAAVQFKVDRLPWIEKLVRDENAGVRRECALSLRGIKSPEGAKLWAELAKQYDGLDRWYLEALGIGADGNWDACFDAWAASQENPSATPAGRDIIWRSRAKDSLPMLVKLIENDDYASDAMKYLRGVEFHKDARVGDLLFQLVQRIAPQRTEVLIGALIEMHGAHADDPILKPLLTKALETAKGRNEFLELVDSYKLKEFGPQLLEMALNDPNNSLRAAAVKQLAKFQLLSLFSEPLTKDDDSAVRAIGVLGMSREHASVELLLSIIPDSKRSVLVRAAAVKGLERSKFGEESLLAMIEKGELAKDLEFTAANVLLNSWERPIQDAARTRFPPAEGANNQKLPPINELVKRKGNAKNGREVFKTVGTCFKCHTISGEGGQVGPNLSEIGSKLGRDGLFESILLPSASIAQQYESYIVELENGDKAVGMIVSETEGELVLKGADGVAKTFEKSEIAEKVKQTVSLMPADLQKLMTLDQLADVVEFLTTLKKPQ
jgi:putative membrane-bound dehydrogenase-like protein